MTSSDFDIRVRRLINHFFVEHGFAPTTHDLVVATNTRATKVAESFMRLQDDHRLLLYPNTDVIWVAHPFTSVPSNYWVESQGRGWWGNCGFCSLGIAAMLKKETCIYTRLGAERKAIEVHITESTITPQDYLLHVPVPIARWHDNVTLTCGQVHYFDSDVSVGEWSDRHFAARGELIPLERAWRLARQWYGDYLDENWQPRSNAETNAMLKSIGLSTSFWHLPTE